MKVSYIYLVGVHRSREEECDIGRSVVLGCEDVYGGKPLDILLCSKLYRKEVAKLHKRVVTLGEKMIKLRFVPSFIDVGVK